MLAEGCALREDKPFFIAGRLDCLFRRLPAGWLPRRVLDFGAAPATPRRRWRRACGGRGGGRRRLGRRWRGRGEPSGAPSRARRAAGLGAFDLCYVNGVFHHIEPAQRGEALAAIHRALRGGGYLALFENNAWNPGARMVMRRIPFDRDAVPISPAEGRRLVADAGFGPPVEVRSLFYFPRALGGLRFLEPWLGRLPLGAQYQVLAAKPGRPRLARYRLTSYPSESFLPELADAARRRSAVAPRRSRPPLRRACAARRLASRPIGSRSGAAPPCHHAASRCSPAPRRCSGSAPVPHVSDERGPATPTPSPRPLTNPTPRVPSASRRCVVVLPI